MQALGRLLFAKLASGWEAWEAAWRTQLRRKLWMARVAQQREMQSSQTALTQFIELRADDEHKRALLAALAGGQQQSSADAREAVDWLRVESARAWQESSLTVGQRVGLRFAVAQMTHCSRVGGPLYYGAASTLLT